jgi:hypothetical protein
VSFAAITLCVTSQSVCVVVIVVVVVVVVVVLGYFVMDSFRKLLDTPSYNVMILHVRSPKECTSI